MNLTLYKNADHIFISVWGFHADESDIEFPDLDIWHKILFADNMSGRNKKKVVLYLIIFQINSTFLIFFPAAVH